MSSAPAKSLQPGILDHFQGWAKSLSETLSFPEGQQCEILPQAPAELSAIAESDVWMVITSSGAVQGQIAFRVTAFGARQLAGEKENTGESEQSKSAVLDLFRKAVARLISPSGSAERGIEVQAEIGTAPSWSDAPLCWLKANLAAPVVIEVWASPEFLASLQVGQTKLATLPLIPDAVPSKLGMLLDVELVVTMRFGGRRMLLKDILDLSTGSVVELDQQVQEPVDLLLDGKLIARGEVVVVDGNYGLRVKEVFSKAEK